MSEQRLTLDDLTVGQHFESGKHTVDVNEIKALLPGFDPQSFHLDEDAPPTGAASIDAGDLWQNLAAFGIARKVDQWP